MESYIEVLRKSRLFQHMSKTELHAWLEPGACTLGRYGKHVIIAQENEPCRCVGFIIEGILSVQQITVSGEMIKIHVFRAGECFGFTQLFSARPKYPYTFITSSAASVLYVSFEKLRALFDTSPSFRTNCLFLFSDTVHMFQNKLRILSQKDVRSKLIIYFSGILSHAETQNFMLPRSKTEVADMLGVARPSLSRELKRMQQDGLISLAGRLVVIKMPEKFQRW